MAGKIMAAEDAVRLIDNGNTLSVCGIIGSHVPLPRSHRGEECNPNKHTKMGVGEPFTSVVKRPGRRF